MPAVTIGGMPASSTEASQAGPEPLNNAAAASTSAGMNARRTASPKATGAVGVWSRRPASRRPIDTMASGVRVTDNNSNVPTIASGNITPRSPKPTTSATNGGKTSTRRRTTPGPSAPAAPYRAATTAP